MNGTNQFQQFVRSTSELIQSRIRTSLWLLTSVTLLFFSYVTPDVAGQDTGEPNRNAPEATSTAEASAKKTTARQKEKWNSGWTIVFDNDLVAGDDGDYTGGLSVSLSGRRAKEWFFSMDPILGFLNNLTGFSTLGKGPTSSTRHSFGFGGAAFTPSDIEEESPIRDEHPYAGVLFVNNVRQRINREEQVSYKSMVTLGVLGTDMIGEVQQELHDFTGSDDPRGWGNQISDGGEPTAQYTLLREELLYSNRSTGFTDFDLTGTFGGSAGYVTQLQGGIEWRLGRLTTDAWGFNPDFGQYVNVGGAVDRVTKSDPFPHELFLWGDLGARARGYNALLQGQFRDSEVTFDKSELNPVIGKASIGVTCGFQTGSRLTAGIKAKTTEIEDTEDDLPVWGTLMFSQAY